MDLTTEECVGFLCYVARSYKEILLEDIEKRPKNVTEDSVNFMVKLIDVSVDKCEDLLDDGALIL